MCPVLMKKELLCYKGNKTPQLCSYREIINSKVVKVSHITTQLFFYRDMFYVPIQPSSTVLMESIYPLA